VRNTNSRITALADLFADQLAAGHKRFNELGAKMGHLPIDKSQLFRGPKAFEEIAASSALDALIIATPDYFHPDHLEAAVAAGKHIYLEKPVAVDVVGCKRVIELGKKADGKLSLAVGFQLRSSPPLAEMVRRIHAGALGTIACGEAYYFARLIRLPDWPDASSTERRLRQWYWDKVLSGDIILDQNIHVFDICNWVLKARPLKATGACDRKVRTEPGDCSDHFAITFHYPGNVHVNFTSTQFGDSYSDVCERFFGSRGTSESYYVGGVRIYGAEPWDAENPAAAGQPQRGRSHFNMLRDADAEKDKAFIASLTSGKFLNEAATGAESALTSILARQAAYQGREITWDEMMESDERYDAGIDVNKLA
jgi:predicted dehydrogenase